MTSESDPPFPVLAEEPHYLAVFKPAGWLVQGARPEDPSLPEALRAWIERRDAKPGRAFLAIVHRIDRPVSGVVVLAKRSKAASRLSDSIRRHEFHKTYRAVVEGRPTSEEGTCRSWLVWSEDRRRTLCHDAPVPNAREAVLRWRVLRAGPDRSVLAIEPITGRKHQIRAQLASIGCPILGDRRYGARRALDDGVAIALLAASVEFPHPVDRERRVRVDVPPDLDPIARWWAHEGPADESTGPR
ncbi:MAG: RNA pseudouridine synthase [bacterium]